MTLLLAKAHRGEETHSVEEAQRGVTAKYPKSSHHPDIPLRCSQLITGNPYNTQPSSYPHHIQAYNLRHICVVRRCMQQQARDSLPLPCPLQHLPSPVFEAKKAAAQHISSQPLMNRNIPCFAVPSAACLRRCTVWRHGRRPDRTPMWRNLGTEMLCGANRCCGHDSSGGSGRQRGLPCT